MIPARVLSIGGHPVILGVVRLACEAAPQLELIGGTDDEDEFVERATLDRPNVAVVDLDLPGRRGVEVLRRVREAGFEGRILVLSERGEGRVVLEAMRAGADGFVVKAEGMRTLATMIVDLASGERVITPELERAAVEELGQVAQRAREGAEVRGILTQREREVLTLLGEGLTMRQIGRRLGISPRTVESHVAKLYRKLGVATRVQALARAATLGLIELE